MSDIPTDVFRQILSRMPVESLLRFRSVCKEWQVIIDDPHFIKSHLNHQTGDEQHIIIRLKTGMNCTNLYALPLKSLDYSKGCIKSIELEATPLKIPRRIRSLPIVSRDGLILISQYGINKVWALWNPFTREFLELPRFDTLTRRKDHDDWFVSGLGYDSFSDDYKVVRSVTFFDKNDMKHYLEILIYSLKIGYWKIIDYIPDCSSPYQSRGALINGKLHWIAAVKKQGTCMKSIIAFDLETENYSVLQLPSNMSGSRERYLDVLDGCLFMSVYNDITSNGFDGWIMKEYEGENVWTKLFSFNGVAVNIGGHVNLRPIAYLKSKHKVLIQYEDEFIWFDIEKKSAKKVNIEGIPSNCSYQAFHGSLVRLANHGTIAGNLGTTKRKRKRANNKQTINFGLKLIVTTSDPLVPQAD